MAEKKEYVKGVSNGTINQLINQEETFNSNRLYAIKDLPINNGITNEQMIAISNNVLVRAFINKNDTFICADEGSYKLGHSYRWTGDSWLDITNLTSFDNYLSKDNIEEYAPTSEYNPTTKKYTDDADNVLKSSIEANNYNVENLITREADEFQKGMVYYWLDEEGDWNLSVADPEVELNDVPNDTGTTLEITARTVSTLKNGTGDTLLV